MTEGTNIDIAAFNVSLARAMRRAGLAPIVAHVDTFSTDWVDHICVVFPHHTPPDVLERALAFAYAYITRHSTYVNTAVRRVWSKEGEYLEKGVSFMCCGLSD